MIPTGKSLFIHRSRNCLDGSIEAIIQSCVDMGLSWIALKIGDAASDYYRSFDDMAFAILAFRAAGIKVWLWHYIYGGVWIDKAGVAHTGGASPAQESAFAKQQVSALEADGYIIDVEREYKVLSQKTRAESYMAGLVGIGVPVALCSYRFPSLHTQLPWYTFLAGSDFHMPQVYHGPGRGIIDLERSYSELMSLKTMPFVPVGRAYIGDGYPAPGPDGLELIDFMGRVETKGCPGVSFWAMDFLTLHEGGAEREIAIAEYDWPGSTPPEPGPDQPLRMRVIRPVLNIRAGPGTGYADLGDLHEGDIVTVGNVSGNDAWVEITPGRWACARQANIQYLAKA